jgi:hypothetical protein
MYFYVNLRKENTIRKNMYFYVNLRKTPAVNSKPVNYYD